LRLTKLDLRKEMREYYRPPVGEVVVIRVPKMRFIMVEGKGAPEGSSFQRAIQTLYGLAFTIKFGAKKTLGKDFPVMPLEGLWWTKGGGFDMKKREDWLWTLMIMQPSLVTKGMFSKAEEELRQKREPSTIEHAGLETFDEGLCVQTMHVGPYSTEAETIAKLEEFAREKGCRMTGKHHEIYLGDPRRAAPSKLRTVIRHQVGRSRV
jgi:hypothetical protein